MKTKSELMECIVNNYAESAGRQLAQLPFGEQKAGADSIASTLATLLAASGAKEVQLEGALIKPGRINLGGVKVTMTNTLTGESIDLNDLWPKAKIAYVSKTAWDWKYVKYLYQKVRGKLPEPYQKDTLAATVRIIACRKGPISFSAMSREQHNKVVELLRETVNHYGLDVTF